MRSFLSSLSVVAAMAAASMLANAEEETASSFYNPGESQGSFDWIMKPYPIPARTTTYTDFFFNIPDDLPDLFHIVKSDVINSQPLHLHHFVINGCPEKVDESTEGMPVEADFFSVRCTVPLGGWAPGGEAFTPTDLSTGVIMGKGMGIQAIQLNVHYTDGVYEDPETQTLKMATDGVRVHYTTDFRPYTTTFRPIINIGSGPRELAIPPGEERFFVTQTCKVESGCKDVDPQMLQMAASFLGGSIEGAPPIPDGITCPLVQPFCNTPGELGSYIQQLCPASCGFCDSIEGQINPLDPGSYRVTGVNYHAHLLGREMYTTLLRNDEDEANAQIQKNVQSSEIKVQDLQSSEFWIYDDQETRVFDFADFVSTDGSNEILKGTEVRPGDKIQATCVYDSTYREERTRFGVSTYDEMCITNLLITFQTPESLLNYSGGNEDTISNLRTELALYSFNCESDEEHDVYTGILAEDEDGRDIWKNHPISATEGCTFPTPEFAGIGGAIFRSRNCPSSSSMDVMEEENSEDAKPKTMCPLEPPLTGHSCVEDGFAQGLRCDYQLDGDSNIPQTYTCAGIGWLTTTDDFVTYEGEEEGEEYEDSASSSMGTTKSSVLVATTTLLVLLMASTSAW